MSQQDIELAKKLDKKQNTEHFTKLCELARACDEDGIKQLLSITIAINYSPTGYFHENKPVVMVMAEEGRENSVNFLIEKFAAEPKMAAEGYARFKHYDAVEKLLLLYDVRDAALEGYASSPTSLVEKEENLLKRGANMNLAIVGNARAGKKERVEELLKRSSNRIDLAIENYAYSGFNEFAELLIIRDAEKTKTSFETNPAKKIISKMKDYYTAPAYAAIAGYIDAGIYDDKDKFLRLLVTTQIDAIRKHYIAFANDHFKFHYQGTTIAAIVKKADAVRHIMSSTNCSLDQAFTQEAAAVAAPVKLPRVDSKATLFAAAKSHTKAATEVVEAPKARK